jgi:crossover junction endodeoxyribonuclease RuvC
LAIIFNEVTKLVDTFSPDESSMEITFVNKNPTTTLILGHARAAAMVAISVRNIPVFEYEPNRVKKILTGGGHADKTAVDKMVRILLPGANPKTPDESDAIAIALAHANTTNFAKFISKAN